MSSSPATQSTAEQLLRQALKLGKLADAERIAEAMLTLGQSTVRHLEDVFASEGYVLDTADGVP